MPPTRITFDVPAVTVQASAGDAAGSSTRGITGTLLPYNVIGRAADGVLYLFESGSLTPLRDRTPLLLGHDRNQPVGVLAELTGGQDAVVARFAVDATLAGDQAIVQAQSGSRAALSVGAQPTLYQLDETGDELVVRVQAADLVDASLVTVSAFEGADVSDVAAQAPTASGGTLMPPQNTGATVNGAAAPAPQAAGSPAAAGSPPDPAVSGGGTPLELHAGHPRLELGGARPAVQMRAGELVALIVRAQHGEDGARRALVEAALVESISTDVSGLLPPTYERAVIGGQVTARPLYQAFGGRPLPGVGLLISKPKWITRPDGVWAADVNADAHSTKVAIGAQTADVARWDWAGAIPWVVVQRSDPSVIDEIYAEAVQDFYLDVEAKIYAELSAAAPGVATSLGSAIAEFYTATGNQHAPEVIVMAPDVWGAYADANMLNVAVAAGSVSGSELSTSFAGIRAITSGTLAPGEVILGTRRAVDARITDPVRLTANAIGALNVELAVVGEGLFDTDYPGELVKFAAIVPTTALALAAGRSSK